MALYLVQHGLSLPKDVDPEKGLSTDGMDAVQRMAEVARGYGIPVGRIIHSGKKRARQTADILAAVLSPDAGVTTVAGINPLDDVAAFASQVDFAAHIMVVGHLPFMERLTSFLILGEPEPVVFKLQNGGILCLDRFENLERPAIRWALMPQVS